MRIAALAWGAGLPWSWLRAARARREPAGVWPAYSAHGRWLGYLEERDPGPALRLLDRRSGTLRPAGPPGVEDFRFAPDGDAVAVVRAAPGSAGATIEVDAAPGGPPRRPPLRTPPGPALLDVSLQAWVADALLFTAAVQGGEERDLHALDVRTGRVRLVARTGDHPSISDHDGTGEAAVTLAHGGRLQQRAGTVRLPAGGSDAGWQPRVLVTAAGGPGAPESVAAVGLLPGSAGLLPGSAGLLVVGNLGREFRALLAVDGEGAVRCVRERPGAELESAALTGDRRRALLVWNVEGRSRLEVVAVPSGEVLARCDPPGDVVHGADIAPGGERIAVAVTGPRQPAQVWEADPDGSRAVPVSPGHPRTRRRAPDAELIRVAGRDGTALTAWVYRPDGAARGCVLSLHGGPDAQERPAHDPLRAALLARGLTVVAPNVRGSRGFGRTFSAKDDREGRFGAREDVVAVAGAALERGLAVPGRLGVLGLSYGGYLALCAVQDAPELFAAGVLVSGVTDLARYVRGTAGWRRPIAAAEFGDPEHDAALLDRLSPLPGLLRSRAPLLVVHGARDRVVPAADAVDVVRRLRGAGRDAELLLVPRAGHGFTPRELGAVTRRVERWFARHLAVAA